MINKVQLLLLDSGLTCYKGKMLELGKVLSYLQESMTNENYSIPHI